jgi:hypothetical protein
LRGIERDLATVDIGSPDVGWPASVRLTVDRISPFVTCRLDAHVVTIDFQSTAGSAISRTGGVFSSIYMITGGTKLYQCR